MNGYYPECLAAIHKNKRVRFYNAVDLVNELEREKQAGKTGAMARKFRLFAVP